MPKNLEFFNKLSLKLDSDIYQSLLTGNISHHFLKILNTRLKGYHQFFGDYVLPFYADDYFADYLSAFHQDNFFLTVKSVPIRLYSQYNLEPPFYKLMKKEVIETKIPKIDDYTWLGSFTYLPVDNINQKKLKESSHEIIAFYFWYLLTQTETKGLILTANLKAKMDILLKSFGFEDADLPTIVHTELKNNDARFCTIQAPSAYLNEVGSEYFSKIAQPLFDKNVA